MYGKLLQPEIVELIDMKDFKTLKEIFTEWHPADLAELISDLPDSEQLIVFRFLPKNLTNTVFEHLPVETQKNIIMSMGKKDITGILMELSPDDRTWLFEELPSSIVKNMLALLTKEERETAKMLLGYPEDSVGRLMTPEYISVVEKMTVAQVLKKIRLEGHESETIEMLYVVDEKGRLLDEISIRQLLLASPSTRIKSMMDRRYGFLRATDDQEIAIEIFKKYDTYSLPVIDTEGFLIGIVTIDDILSVAEEETTEDIHKLGGMNALDESYLKSSVFTLIKKRAVWLIFLFIGGTFTASAMGFFEDAISAAVVLTMFVPLIIASGGNSGSQATSLIIRSLAIGELTISDWWEIMKREIISGLALGILLGSIGFAKIAISEIFTGFYGPHWFFIGITIFISLIGIVMWGTLAGSMLPLLLKRLKLDPATSSAPFVATLVDVTGIVIYFTTAQLLLKGKIL